MLYPERHSNFDYSDHRLEKIDPIRNTQKRCIYCNIMRIRTKSNQTPKSYFYCSVCGVSLCKSDRNCFHLYHQLIASNTDMQPFFGKKVCCSVEPDNA